jgi:hypothetical protein
MKHIRQYVAQRKAVWVNKIVVTSIKFACLTKCGPSFPTTNQSNLKQSLILSWLFENINVHKWTHVLKASILNVFLSIYHLRDPCAIAENQLCKFRVSKKRDPTKHTSISKCHLLVI